MTRIILCGILGRLGSALREACSAAPDLEIVCGVDTSADGSGVPPVFESFGAQLPQADLVADCSCPAALEAVTAFCRARRLPLLCCVTGYSEEQEAELRALSRLVPVQRAVNMASGIPAFFRLVEAACALLPQADIDLIETHKRAKRDAPSGTAALLARRIAEQAGRAPLISSVRTGNAAGSHAVLFDLGGETLTLEHRALSLSAYAAGALPLLRALPELPPGYYTAP